MMVTEWTLQFDYPYKLVKEGKWANVPVVWDTQDLPMV